MNKNLIQMTVSH